MPRLIFEINNRVLECLNLNILLVVVADGSCILSIIFLASNTRGDESSYWLRVLPERYKDIREVVPFIICATGVLCLPWSHTQIMSIHTTALSAYLQHSSDFLPPFWKFIVLA